MWRLIIVTQFVKNDSIVWLQNVYFSSVVFANAGSENVLKRMTIIGVILSFKSMALECLSNVKYIIVSNITEV